MRAHDLPGREEHLRRWAALHGAPAPSGVVRWWLSLVHVLARPLARAGVPPTALTAAGLLLPLAALPAAAAGGRWALVVPVLVAVSGVVDSLDGGVAVLRGRTTSWGAVADALADRLADALALAALWLLGAPGPVVVAAGALAALAEYARARGAAAGVRDVGVVTVGERPTRVLVVAAAALVAGLRPDAAGTWAAVGAWAALAVAVVALLQLVPVLRRQLQDLDAGGTGGPDDGAPDGVPDDGAPDDGVPDDGAPADGAPADGAPADGAPADGAPADGAPDDGAPDDGAPDDRAPDDRATDIGGGRGA